MRFPHLPPLDVPLLAAPAPPHRQQGKDWAGLGSEPGKVPKPVSLSNQSRLYGPPAPHPCTRPVPTVQLLGDRVPTGPQDHRWLVSAQVRARATAPHCSRRGSKDRPVNSKSSVPLQRSPLERPVHREKPSSLRHRLHGQSSGHDLEKVAPF